MSFLLQLAQTNSSGAGGAILGGGMLLIVLLISIATFVLWIWALVDLLKSSRSSNEKILWALVIIFLGFIGAIIYLVVGRGGSSGMSV